MDDAQAVCVRLAGDVLHPRVVADDDRKRGRRVAPPELRKNAPSAITVVGDVDAVYHCPPSHLRTAVLARARRDERAARGGGADANESKGRQDSSAGAAAALVRSWARAPVKVQNPLGGAVAADGASSEGEADGGITVPPQHRPHRRPLSPTAGFLRLGPTALALRRLEVAAQYADFCVHSRALELHNLRQAKAIFKATKKIQQSRGPVPAVRIERQPQLRCPDDAWDANPLVAGRGARLPPTPLPADAETAHARAVFLPWNPLVGGGGKRQLPGRGSSTFVAFGVSASGDRPVCASAAAGPETASVERATAAAAAPPCVKARPSPFSASIVAPYATNAADGRFVRSLAHASHTAPSVVLRRFVERSTADVDAIAKSDRPRVRVTCLPEEPPTPGSASRVASAAAGPDGAVLAEVHRPPFAAVSGTARDRAPRFPAGRQLTKPTEGTK